MFTRSSLPQMGIRLAAAMGNEVTVISTNPSKREMALKTGAKHFIVSKVLPLSCDEDRDI